jgi:hypothetical protein
MGKMEVTTKRVATVDSVQEAFAFIMEHLDDAGPSPRIEIEPFTDLLGGIQAAVEAANDPNGADVDLFGTVKFEVSITYMEEVERG